MLEIIVALLSHVHTLEVGQGCTRAGITMRKHRSQSILATERSSESHREAGQRSPSRWAAEDALWELQEDWAVEDCVAEFTVGDEHRVTFWSSFTAAHPELSQRSPQELEARAALLNCPVGKEPAVLSSAMRKEDGRWSGWLDGNRVSVTVEKEGRLASGDAYVQSISGKIYAVDRFAMSELHTDHGEALSYSSTRTPADVVELEQKAETRAGERRGCKETLVTCYLATLATSALLLVGQLFCIGIDVASVPACHEQDRACQQHRVDHLRGDIIHLEHQLELRREAWDSDQQVFISKMSVLEPQLRASERTLAELNSNR